MRFQEPSNRTYFSKEVPLSAKAALEFRRPLHAILSIVEDMSENSRAGSEHQLTLIRENARALLANLNEVFPSDITAPAGAIQPPALIRSIGEGAPAVVREGDLQAAVRQIVLDHLQDQSLDPGLICRKMGISRTQLYRKMKEHKLGTVARFIRSVRLQVGLQLLETTSLSVGEVAYRVGFRDQSYFSRTFLKEFGIRPREVR